MTEYSADLPTQKEIEKELSDYLYRKYGDRVKIVGLQPQLEKHKQQITDTKKPTKKFCADFNIKPEELVAYLDEYVIRQDEAKAILATKVCTHFNRVRLSMENSEQTTQTVGQIKNNILLIGPTGVGKTFLIKLIAKRIGVPFVKGDATKFSETGYVGGDVEDLVRDLVRETGGDIESAQHGIIYVDEIDKIAATPNSWGLDVSRGGVQRALLKPMEETEVDLKVPHDPISQVEAIEYYRATGKRQKRLVNTKNILFIMSGAFKGLEEIVKKRLQKQTIGFEGSITSKTGNSRFQRKAKAEDLIEFGFESEFVGRLPVLACLDELSINDLYEILRSPNNAVLIGKKLDFNSYGIRIQFEDEALLKIAQKASRERTGARGLVSIMEKVLLQFEKKLPSTEIRYLAVTKELINAPAAELEKLCSQAEHQAYHESRCHLLGQQERSRLADFILKTQKNFFRQVDIIPTPAKIELMARKCQDKTMEPRDVCDIFVKLIKQIRWCAENISIKCGIKVTFSEEAVDRILAGQPLSAEAIKTRCRSLLNNFEYGLRLLEQKKGVKEIIITADGVDAPEQFINKLVGNNFKI